MNKILDDLIQEGKTYTFNNNSVTHSHGTYGSPSVNMQSWVVKVEHFILENYEENSGPANLFKTFDRSKLKGNTQYDFEKQHTILMAVLDSCKHIPPKNQTKKNENDPILSLLTNKLFWGTILVLVSGAFTLGYYFGNSKFDSRLIELTDNNKTLRDSVQSRDFIISRMKTISDSALNILGHMPYNEMTLDSMSYRKVQTTIENAGAALYINKNYKY